MIKWIVIAVAAYILYRLFANDILKKRKKNEKQDEKDIAVKDPQCGTYVSVEDSITVRDGDKVYHFCSYDCRDKFLKRIADGGQPVAPEVESKTPAGAEVRTDQADSGPKQN